MRKIAALMLALILTLSTLPALADSTYYKEHRHPTQGYTVEYPAQWLALDSRTVSSYISGAVDAGTEFQGLLASLDEVAAQIKAQEMVMFMRSDGTNINVIALNVGARLKISDLKAMLPALHTQYEAIYANPSFLDEGSAVCIDDKDMLCIAMEYTLNGVRQRCYQLLVPQGTRLFYFTLTVGAENDSMKLALELANMVESLDLDD